MRKNYQMWLLGALFGGLVLPFAGCSNEDDPTPNGPGNGETVKAQFAINIPYAGKAETKMSADNTQNNNNFLGMYDIRLLPMTTTGADNVAYSSIISLENIAATNGLESNTYKLYDDVNIPVGTTNFLFYAAGGAGAPTNNFAQGILNANYSGSNNTTSDFSFSLEKAKGTDTDDQQNTLLGVLNAVEDAFGTPADQSLEEALYDKFIALKAGSANSIRATLEALYNEIENSTTLKEAIRNAITNDGTFWTTGTKVPYTLNTSLTYPQNMNMPDGSVVLSFKDGAFSDATNNANIGVDMSNICYPASIYYFINTPLWASSSSTFTWPTSVSNWENDVNWSGFTGSVASNTRIIALKKAAQYAVANMALTVKCDGYQLQDKGSTTVPVPDEGFPVTGVLVNGQPTQVGWNFLPKSGDRFSNIVYDKTLTRIAAKANAAEGTNYTLLLDNYQETTAAKVPVVVELKNNSTTAFEGHDGIIPIGATFYLVAELDPSAYTGQWVFMQDHTTTVNLTIKSLKNAYNTIPDLQSATLQLGLAVDLTWQDGISFDVELGGD